MKNKYSNNWEAFQKGKTEPKIVDFLGHCNFKAPLKSFLRKGYDYIKLPSMFRSNADFIKKMANKFRIAIKNNKDLHTALVWLLTVGL